MTFKVVSGSGTRNKPLSRDEQLKRLEAFKVINWKPQKPLKIGWIKIDHDDTEITALIYRVKFGWMETDALVTIRVVFDDEQSSADMAITHMTTLPYEVHGQGYGTEALQMLLKSLKEKGLTNIQAVQVQKYSEPFWIKNGFIALHNVTNDFQYIQK